MSVITVACDLCKGQRFTARYAATISAVNRSPEQYYSSSRLHAGHLPIVQCQNCGLVMSNPRDDDETIAAIYAGLNDPIYANEQRNRERVAHQRSKLIRHYLRGSSIRLLDIGCATGIFAGTASAYDMAVTGIDPSAWSIQQALRRYSGVNFIAGQVENAKFQPDSFDALCLWDVLEHVASPSHTINLISPWLQGGGYLFLNLPNVESQTAKLMGKRWVLFLREHLWYFSPKTISRLLEAEGYQIEHIGTNLVTFSLDNIIRRAAQYFPNQSKLFFSENNRLNKLLASVSLIFPMGEMTIIARKVK